MTKLIFLIWSFPLFSYVNTQTDYCRLSCDGQIHTVCHRRDVNCGIDVDNCGSPYEAITLDEKDIKLVLDVHNELRNRVATGRATIRPQPSAANMKALSYNRELGEIAQCLANTCNIRHDQCRRTRDFEWVGQNIGKQKFSKHSSRFIDYRMVINVTINDWYDDVKNFRPKWVSSFPITNRVIGHYTQLVWAETEEVGCGLIFSTRSGKRTYFLACNYGPGGNNFEHPVYEIGSPASNCSRLPLNSKYEGLCGEERIK